MKTILVVMLCMEIAILLVAAFAVAVQKRADLRRPPLWSSLALSLVIVAGVSWSIAADERGTAGGDLVQFGAALLFGMAVMAALAGVRQRRGLDTIR